MVVRKECIWVLVGEGCRQSSTLRFVGGGLEEPMFGNSSCAMSIVGDGGVCGVCGGWKDGCASRKIEMGPDEIVQQ